MGVLHPRGRGALRRLLRGRPSPCRRCRCSTPDFAVWQRALAAGTRPWRPSSPTGGSAWAAIPSPSTCPLDRPRPAVQTFRGESLPLRLPAALGRRPARPRPARGGDPVHDPAGGLRRPPRPPDRPDRHPGRHPDRRPQPVETEGLVGFFLNTLVLRTDLSGGPSFRGAAGAGAARRPSAPTPTRTCRSRPCSRSCSPSGDLRRTPFFQVFFNMLNFPAEAGPLVRADDRADGHAGGAGRSSTSRSTWPRRGRRSPATSSTTPTCSTGCGWTSSPVTYERLLEQAAEAPRPGSPPSPCAPLARPRCCPIRPHPCGDEWRGAVHELFRERARRHPEGGADRRRGDLDYGELDRATDRLAARLRAAGVEKGDRVAVFAHRSAPVAWAVMGALKAGAAFADARPGLSAGPADRDGPPGRPRAWIEIAAAGNPPNELEETLAALAAQGTLLARVAPLGAARPAPRRSSPASRKNP